MCEEHLGLQPPLPALDTSGETLFVPFDPATPALWGKESLGGVQMKLPASLPDQTIVCAVGTNRSYRFWQVTQKTERRFVVEPMDVNQENRRELFELAKKELMPIEVGKRSDPLQKTLGYSEPQDGKPRQLAQNHFQLIKEGMPNPYLVFAVLTPENRGRYMKTLPTKR